MDAHASWVRWFSLGSEYEPAPDEYEASSLGGVVPEGERVTGVGLLGGDVVTGDGLIEDEGGLAVTDAAKQAPMLQTSTADTATSFMVSHALTRRKDTKSE